MDRAKNKPAIAKVDLYETAVRADNLKTFAKALDAAGLKDTIKGSGPFTILVPTDEAFAQLPPGMLDDLLQPENREKLARILAYHVLPGRVLSDRIARLRLADTVQGTTLLIRSEKGKIFVDGARVVKVDIPASNGVIHVIDRVVMPQNLADTAMTARQFTKLLAAMKAAGLFEVLQGEGDNLTLFAPTDEAFAALPAGTLDDLLKPANRDELATILKHHLAAGRLRIKAGKLATLAGPPLTIEEDEGVFMVNGANVLMENIKTTNGVIHMIDRVLMPPSDKPDRSAAMLLIEKAIERGVPAFNQGDPGTCAAVYEAAARSLLGAHADALDEPSRHRLMKVLDKVREEPNVRKRSWMLRHALDDVHGWLGKMR